MSPLPKKDTDIKMSVPFQRFSHLPRNHVLTPENRQQQPCSDKIEDLHHIAVPYERQHLADNRDDAERHENRPEHPDGEEAHESDDDSSCIFVMDAVLIFQTRI